MTIHLVYAKGIRTSAPHVITRELSSRLRRHHNVQVYDLAERRVIVPEPGDVLIGHPHQDPLSVLTASFAHEGWAKRIIMCPYSHGIPEICAWVDDLVCAADSFLAITGNHWFETMDQSLFSHWKYKTRQLDLAVDPQHFPPLKTRWNPPGKRRFLYIGYSAPAKGTDYLAALADAAPQVHFGWIGGGTMTTDRIEILGPCDFNLPDARALVAEYDFLITTGRSDANPTTILEALAWGLLPVCTPQSGYRGQPWLVNIPLDDLPAATRILHDLNAAPEDELQHRVTLGRQELQRHFTWQRFAADVMTAIQEPVAPRPPGQSDWEMRAAHNRRKLRELILPGRGS
ncbi:MAG: hypothetical protein ACTHN5_21335 [Phycisphaerae bacterium]